MDKNIGVIVASGTHPLPSEKDLKNLILSEYYPQLRELVTFNNSKVDDEFFTAGTTSRSTKVRIGHMLIQSH